ncbi:hypothetical protein ACOSQ4_013749 [Xanthoceras sorbifolium]
MSTKFKQNPNLLVFRTAGDVLYSSHKMTCTFPFGWWIKAIVDHWRHINATHVVFIVLTSSCPRSHMSKRNNLGIHPES